ncbi:MAG: hypothetical protein ACI9FN_002109 [Saprospiraceae bacterium]|jgi:hypothetical protein
MKKLIITLGCIATTILFIRCSEGFLDRTPPGTGTVEGFYNSEDELVFGINGVYQTFQGDWWAGGFVHLQPHLEGATENGKVCCAWEHGIVQLATGTTNPTTGGFTQYKWIWGFRAITRINQLLAVMEEGVPELNQENMNKWEGELKFLRAFVYQQLIFYYGDVPLITTPLTPEEASAKGRTPKSEILDLILLDLDFAIANLSISPNRDDFGRPTSQAASALKGKTLLYAERWSDAASAFESVIALEGGAVSLDPDFESLFRGLNEQSSEILFSLQYVGEGQVGAGQGEGTMMQTHYAPTAQPDGLGAGWSSLLHSYKMRDAFYMTDGLPIDQSPLYDAALPFENRDPRMGMTFLIPGNRPDGTPYSTFRGFPVEPDWIVMSGIPASQWVGAAGFGTKKWVTEFDDTGFSDDFSQDFILIRYSDVLLMYAEARNEASGPDGMVYDALNKIRARVGMPDFPPGLSQGEMREEIRHERNVELAMEGVHYNDLLRWRIAETVITSLPEFESRIFDPSKHYLWPIPQSAIDSNPNIAQNPGY